MVKRKEENNVLFRYPGRITNGRMLTGRMSVTEVIPELIPEEPPVSYYNLS